jgi:CubicO group peptidase (beta-lactamase class C family)
MRALTLPVVVLSCLSSVWPAVATDRKADAQRLVQPLIDGGVIPGAAVGVLENGSTQVFGFGRVSMMDDSPPRGDTIYELGSISKVLTGVLLADAVERGELKSDDPLSKHMPAGKRAPRFGDEEIRLWHLASHTSSLPRLPNNIEATSLENPYSQYDETKLWAFLDGHTLSRTPGSQYAYSNLGAGLLGTVVARRAGTDYPDLLAKRLAGPLEMKDTTVELSNAQKRRLAPPYESGCKPATNWDFKSLVGCGGVRSTVNDMLKFMQATLDYRNDGIHKAIKQSTTKRFDIPGGGAIGLGWHIAADGFTWWHNGQTAGYHTAMFVNPVNRTGVVILSNGADGAIDASAERMVQIMAGLSVDPPEVRQHVTLTHLQLDRLVGEYVGTGMTMTITRDDNMLMAQLTGQAAFPVFAETPTKFFYRVVEAELHFSVSQDVASTVTLHQNGMKIPFSRN